MPPSHISCNASSTGLRSYRFLLKIVQIDRLDPIADDWSHADSELNAEVGQLIPVDQDNFLLNPVHVFFRFT